MIQKMTRIIFVLMFLLMNNLAVASHVRGADMSYVSLGNQQYLVIAKVYRDCNGVALGSTMTLSAFGGKNGAQNCAKVSLGSMNRIKISDITNVCADSLPCNPANTYGVGNGLEEHVFQLVIDFNQAPLKGMSLSSCPEITFSINECCRNGAITTGSAGNDFYAICMINRGNLSLCTRKENTSPQWANKPVARLCCNVPWYYNNDMLDTFDYDSISYHLVPGLSGLPNTTINYNVPFSYQYPMTPYCTAQTIKCIPNTKVFPPVGFSLDPVTGDMAVTPSKCDESAVIVVEQREFRADTLGNMILVGKTRRDFQYVVSDKCSANNPPVISGNGYLEVLEGQSLCFKISVKDSIVRSAQTKADTVFAQWNGGIPNATFKVVDATKREKEYEFCWNTQIGDGKNTPYGFTVIAQDNNCNPVLNSTRNFKVKVLKINAGVTSSLGNVLSIDVFPNPTENQLNIEIEGNYMGAPHLRIRNLLGSTIYESNLAGRTSHIENIFSKSGTYFVEIMVDGKMFVRKMVKK